MPFLAQRRELLGAHAEPRAEHVVDVLAELRRRLDRRRRPIEAHRPGRHLDLACRRVVDGLHDAALGERRIVQQLQRVEHRTRWNAGRADQLHRLFLGVPAGPGGDDLVDLCPALGARRLGVITRVAAQILAADDLEQALPVLGVGTAAEDVDVVVGSAGLAWIESTRRQPAGGRPAASVAHDRLAAELGAGERHAHVVQHRILHRHLQEAALPGLGALVERAQDADRHQHAGAGVAEGGSRLHRRPSSFAGNAERAARGLRDHVECEALLVRAAGAEALDLAIDDAGVDLLDLVIAQAQPLDGAGRHVLDGDIGLLQQTADDLEPARRLEVQGHRFLVGVELMEIPRVGLGALQPAAGIARARALDLHHLGAEPGEGFGARRPCLELGEIHDANTFETIEFDANAHRRSPVAQK